MKALMLAAAAVVFSVPVMAGQSATSGASAQAAAKEHTMTGCLRKGAEANTYYIENTGEGKSRTVSILDPKDNPGPHVGHKVDITGIGVPNPDAEAMSPKPAKADHYMKISAIKMVSATCP